MRRSAPIEVWLAQYNVKQATPLLRLAVRGNESTRQSREAQEMEGTSQACKAACFLDAANSF